MARRFSNRRGITTHIGIMAIKLGMDLGLTRDQLYRKPEQWLRDKYKELRAECKEKGIIKGTNENAQPGG